MLLGVLLCVVVVVVVSSSLPPSLLSVVCCLLSVVCCLLSVVCCLLFVVAALFDVVLCLFVVVLPGFGTCSSVMSFELSVLSLVARGDVFLSGSGVCRLFGSVHQCCCQVGVLRVVCCCLSVSIVAS